ncbi:MAG: hypothetical protein Q8P56_03795 [Candidatus Uhrbacteria bacterium]|nr:hypothetical protein [Candidatus Uhrbacteria bacterium]
MTTEELKKILDEAKEGTLDKHKQLELLKMANKGLLELNKTFSAILSEMEEQKTRTQIEHIQAQKKTKKIAQPRLRTN